MMQVRNLIASYEAASAAAAAELGPEMNDEKYDKLWDAEQDALKALVNHQPASIPEAIEQIGFILSAHSHPDDPNALGETTWDHEGNKNPSAAVLLLKNALSFLRKIDVPRPAPSKRRAAGAHEEARHHA